MSLVQQVREQLPGLGWSDYDAWWLAAGTGTTLAGCCWLRRLRIRCMRRWLCRPIMVSSSRCRRLCRLPDVRSACYQLHAACRGGFAKVDASCSSFMQRRRKPSGVPLEPLYTAKALMALRQQVEAGYFARGSRLVFVHTGGLQGRAAALLQHARRINAATLNFTSGAWISHERTP